MNSLPECGARNLQQPEGKPLLYTLITYTVSYFIILSPILLYSAILYCLQHIVVTFLPALIEDIQINCDRRRHFNSSSEE